MCGRYTVFREVQEIKARFNAWIDEGLYKRSFNAAPSHLLPVVSTLDPEKISFFRWGLIPSWAKDLSIGSRMINARSETLHEKPSFRSLLRSRRCLVIADGYYEWKQEGKIKQPYYICRKDNDLFAFAGLWDIWKSNDGEIYSFTIITTTPNPELAGLHHRMPVILAHEHEKNWINPDFPVQELREILIPLEDEQLTYHPVSREVNIPSNNNAALVAPLNRDQ